MYITGYYEKPLIYGTGDSGDHNSKSYPIFNTIRDAHYYDHEYLGFDASRVKKTMWNSTWFIS